MTKPKKETWYCYKEFKTVEGYEKEGPRLLTPWSNPHEHEFPFDYIYETPEKARQGLITMANLEDESDEGVEEFLAQEGWVLCRMTLEPILGRS